MILRMVVKGARVPSQLASTGFLSVGEELPQCSSPANVSSLAAVPTALYRTWQTAQDQ